MICYIDTETYSPVPLYNGLDRYAAEAELLLITYAVGDGPVHCLTPDGLGALRTVLCDPRVTLVAHNAEFDRTILNRTLHPRLPPERFLCTRAQAYSHSLPGSLGALAIALGLPEGQRKLDGDKLIKTFCIPGRKGRRTLPSEAPEDWAQFRAYAVRDVETLRAVHKALPTSNYFGNVYHLDQRINERGFLFDRQLALAVVRQCAVSDERNRAQAAALTQNEVQSTTQRDALLDWIRARYDVPLESLRAADVREALETDALPQVVRELLELRLSSAKTSIGKWRRGLLWAAADDRMRYTKQFCGAGRTGRWSGKGYQPDNAARPVLLVQRANGGTEQLPIKASYIDAVVMPAALSARPLDCPELFGTPEEAAALLLRHAIIAAPGNELIVADYSNVESRVLAWLAGESWKLAAYAAKDAGTGEDLYKLLYGAAFGQAPADVNDNERQAGKVMELAFGFGGGVPALAGMAALYNIKLASLAQLVLPTATPMRLAKAHDSWARAFLSGDDLGLEPPVYQACDVLKQAYREANPAINQFRYELFSAVRTAILRPAERVRVGAHVTVWRTGSCLIIQLPDRSRLLYWHPQVVTLKRPDPETGEPRYSDVIRYTAARGRNWRPEHAWSGTFVENVVQAVANRLLRCGLLAVQSHAQQQGWLTSEVRTPIVLHIHDEIVCELHVGLLSVDTLIELMTRGIEWARGLPLHAQGWRGPRYGKRE